MLGPVSCYFTLPKPCSSYHTSVCKVLMIYLANVGQLIFSLYTGLLLLRAYAISGRKRLVLLALGILEGCTVILYLVRSHISVVLEPA